MTATKTDFSSTYGPTEAVPGEAAPTAFTDSSALVRVPGPVMYSDAPLWGWQMYCTLCLLPWMVVLAASAQLRKGAGYEN